MIESIEKLVGDDLKERFKKLNPRKPCCLWGLELKEPTQEYLDAALCKLAFDCGLAHINDVTNEAVYEIHKFDSQRVMLWAYILASDEEAKQGLARYFEDEGIKQKDPQPAQLLTQDEIVNTFSCK